MRTSAFVKARAYDNSLHHLVYSRVVDAIHSGELRPGDRLNEVEIATRLGISRSPVREAFVRLAHDGLVERHPRRGTFVAKLEDDDVAQTSAVRALIEGYAARTACTTMTTEDETTLREILSLMVKGARTRDWIRTANLNAQFHETVVRLAGSVVLNRVWASLDPLVWLIATTVPPGSFHDPDDLIIRHEALIDALRSRDPDLAEYAFRQHIAEATSKNLMGSRSDGVDTNDGTTTEQ